MLTMVFGYRCGMENIPTGKGRFGYQMARSSGLKVVVFDFLQGEWRAPYISEIPA